MEQFENQTFDGDRALFKLDGVFVSKCSFDNKANGESALKECKNVSVSDSFLNQNYLFWHNEDLKIWNCQFTENCQSPLWYSNHVEIDCSSFHCEKALRECSTVKIANVLLFSPEFGWYSKDIEMKDITAQGDYFFMQSENLQCNNLFFSGKYAFQYTRNSVFENCEITSSDALWHAKNVVVKNSLVKGDFVGWYSENLTFEDCRIEGKQPLCNCKNLKLINCAMNDCDYAFENSDVNATVYSEIESIRNPTSGIIKIKGVKEVIMDSPDAKCAIKII